MNVQILEDILRRLLESLDIVLQSGEVLSDEIQGELANVIQNLLMRIEELRSQELPEAPIELPELDKSMQSSNINSFGYDDKTGQLLVKFQGDYPQENGPVYSYEGVPKQIFELFKRGAVPARTKGQNKWGKWWEGKHPSMGASLYTLIRGGGYPYQRLT